MPDVSRFGPERAVDFLRPLVAKGLKSVLLFSVTDMEKVSAEYYLCTT